MDFCPGYWDWLIREDTKGTVLSIDRVQDELTGTPDALGTWAGAGGAGAALFKATKTDAATIAQYGSIAAWVGTAPRFTNPHRAAFLGNGVADPWLIAYALAHGHTIVTLEQPAGAGSPKVKIPDVCIHFGVTYCGIEAALRATGASLKL